VKSAFLVTDSSELQTVANTTTDNQKLKIHYSRSTMQVNHSSCYRLHRNSAYIGESFNHQTTKSVLMCTDISKSLWYKVVDNCCNATDYCDYFSENLFLFFLPYDATQSKLQAVSQHLSVRLSVYPSHSCIASKGLKILYFFLSLVASPF